MLYMLINPVAGVEVLESCEEDFFEHVDAKMIIEDPQSEVIPEHIRRKIKEAAARQEANDILFDYLMSNSSKSSLFALSEVIKTAKGANEKMVALGQDMLLKLEQGVCACACVYTCEGWCGRVCMYDVRNVSGIHE